MKRIDEMRNERILEICSIVKSVEERMTENM